jgi:hypothetical protein
MLHHESSAARTAVRDLRVGGPAQAQEALVQDGVGKNRSPSSLIFVQTSPAASIVWTHTALVGKVSSHDKEVVMIRNNVIGYYVAGFVVCALGLVLSYLLRNNTALPGMIRNLVAGLPWISVAIVIARWRAKEQSKAYPLAYVFGVATPFIVVLVHELMR